MMQRRIYRAIIKAGYEQKAIEQLKLVKERQFENLSLFKYDRQVFLYFEFENEEIFPEVIFTEAKAYLEAWPGFDGYREWVLMHDIFHYQTPQNSNEWKRKTKVEKPWGRVIRLKPEMVASYIFYHYQYQEEKPGDGDKYGIIGIHDDLLFFYCEMPTYLEKPSYQGLLNTDNTPVEWVDLMQKHFKIWPDAKDKNDNWRDAEVLVTFHD